MGERGKCVWGKGWKGVEERGEEIEEMGWKRGGEK